jgi:hypothetical protein
MKASPDFQTESARAQHHAASAPLRCCHRRSSIGIAEGGL